MKCIQYAEGYKYQLRFTYVDVFPIKPAAPIDTAFLRLDTDGTLTIRAGYAWDGPSGLTIDTKDFMRPSLVHDAFYQLMREGHLPLATREAADALLRELTRQDGMWAPRRWWVYNAVRIFGEPCADPAAISPDQLAPAGCVCAT